MRHAEKDRAARDSDVTTRVTSDHPAIWAMVVLLALITLAASVVKLRYGVNPTDEALHVALAWRFVLGSTPIVDEWSLAQFAGVLAAPFVQLFVALRDSTDGLIWAWRLGFLALQIATAAVAARFFRRFVSPAVAVLMALPLVAFVPWSAPTLGYNTLSAAFLAMGLLVGADMFFDGLTRRRAIATGVLHALAAFAYPTLVPLVVVYAVLLYRLGEPKKRSAVWWYLAIGLAGTLAQGLLALAAGPDVLRSMVLWMSSIGNQAGGVGKLLTVLGALRTYLVAEPFLLLGAAALLLSDGPADRSRLRRAAATTALALAPVLTLPLAGFFPMNWTLGFVLFYALLALPALYWLRDSELGRTLVGAMVVPAVVAVALFTYSSNNGLLNAGLGLIAAFCVAQLVMVLGIQRISAAYPGRLARIVKALAVVPALLALGVMLVAGRAGVYGEATVAGLTATVSSGPYRGMVTTPQMAAHMELLQATVDEYVESGDRVLFFDDMASGYLFTSATPATNTPWTFSLMNRPDDYAEAVGWYFEHDHELPTVVVQQLKPPFYDIKYVETNPYMHLLESGDYTKIADDGVFAVYRLGGS